MHLVEGKESEAKICWLLGTPLALHFTLVTHLLSQSMGRVLD